MKKSDEAPDPLTSEELPMAARPIEDVPGHWLLARLGKRVLRPGGRELTEQLLQALPLGGREVVELAPGLGLTAREILGNLLRNPAARRRVLAMRRTFRRHRDALVAVALVARRPPVEPADPSSLDA